MQIKCTAIKTIRTLWFVLDLDDTLAYLLMFENGDFFSALSH